MYLAPRRLFFHLTRELSHSVRNTSGCPWSNAKGYMCSPAANTVRNSDTWLPEWSSVTYVTQHLLKRPISALYLSSLLKKSCSSINDFLIFGSWNHEPCTSHSAHLSTSCSLGITILLGAEGTYVCMVALLSFLKILSYSSIIISVIFFFKHAESFNQAINAESIIKSYFIWLPWSLKAIYPKKDLRFLFQQYFCICHKKSRRIVVSTNRGSYIFACTIFANTERSARHMKPYSSFRTLNYIPTSSANCSRSCSVKKNCDNKTRWSFLNSRMNLSGIFHFATDFRMIPYLRTKADRNQFISRGTDILFPFCALSIYSKQMGLNVLRHLRLTEFKGHKFLLLHYHIDHFLSVSL